MVLPVATVVHFLNSNKYMMFWVPILVQVTIHRRLRIGRDGHLDLSEAYDIL